MLKPQEEWLKSPSVECNRDPRIAEKAGEAQFASLRLKEYDGSREHS